MKLRCHCRNVQIEVTHKPESLTSCNCSVCFRYGSLWGYFKPEEVTLNFQKTSTQSYVYGEENISFEHCITCGCLTHYITTDNILPTKYGVNFRMIDPALLRGIKLYELDGAKTWERISEKTL